MWNSGIFKGVLVVIIFLLYVGVILSRPTPSAFLTRWPSSPTITGGAYVPF